jgi:hypothetical protein
MLKLGEFPFKYTEVRYNEGMITVAISSSQWPGARPIKTSLIV